MELTDIRQEALDVHKKYRGKLETKSKVPVNNAKDLSLYYSPGVAEPCKEIQKSPETIYEYTNKGNVVAVVSDGSAVLGLGDIGAEASLPVMEGKAILFKNFAGVDAIPLCLDTDNIEEFIKIVKSLEPAFGGINLEDIKAPNCFEIEERLKQEMGIPVFHDDQHGTAIVTLAGLVNALKLVDKEFPEIKVVINGAGSAGVAIVKLLLQFGVKDIILCDSKGAIYKGRSFGMNDMKVQIAELTNNEKKSGKLEDVIEGADVFIGVSVAGALTSDMVKMMNNDPIVFAMANPIPEIMPDEAIASGVKVIGTGRSDFPNQINNVLAFPGIFRGALDVRATEINEEMKIAAVYALAELVTEEEISKDYVIPSPFDKRVATSVASAVSKAAIASGVSKNIVEKNKKTQLI